MMFIDIMKPSFLRLLSWLSKSSSESQDRTILRSKLVPTTRIVCRIEIRQDHRQDWWNRLESSRIAILYTNIGPDLLKSPKTLIKPYQPDTFIFPQTRSFTEIPKRLNPHLHLHSSLHSFPSPSSFGSCRIFTTEASALHLWFFTSIYVSILIFCCRIYLLIVNLSNLSNLNCRIWF